MVEAKGENAVPAAAIGAKVPEGDCANDEIPGLGARAAGAGASAGTGSVSRGDSPRVSGNGAGSGKEAELGVTSGVD